ncbi:hypothetical protein E8E12_011577 [Didymella heteroderae]|uniref:Uncharacterized protein n=1 Tax=Didymella heteroderae TaxID=1769908 RepID=A0A9P4X0H1_9PLEO|nr:hypothetical protein E8E12_011577 [Didymella heteroderae]
MERPVSVLRRRTTSFNPEAAAFSPVSSSPSPQDIAKAPTASPTPPQDADFPFATVPMFNLDPPIHDAGSARPLYCRNPLASAPLRLEEFFSQDGQAILKKLEEHPDSQEIRAPPMPRPGAAPTAEVLQDPKPTLPHFTFPEPASKLQHAYAPVDINELSAGLGLPSAKVETNQDASTVVSHESRLPQAHPGALYGKLIGWALDKPLTAKGLAEYLQNQDASTPLQGPGPMSVSPARTAARSREESTPTKSQSPSIQGMKTPNLRRIATPSPPETIAGTKGRDPTMHYQHHRNSSTASYRQHSRVLSRRYPRRPSRAKRSDQGPLPSAADIYPDDARWTPSAPLYETAQDYLSCDQSRQMPEQPQIVITNPFNWPPPAQVYAPEPPPTRQDVDDADSDILKLMDELPEPSLCTLAKLGNTHDLRATSVFGLESAGLTGDERALTPGQQDGSRYGIRFWGLGYGDQWELLKVRKFQGGMFGDEAFRFWDSAMAAKHVALDDGYSS